ncbi:glycosyltransferase [Paenibacillus sacheonensis]|uniref:Glycosyltransferase n=1 Tax=Paenibacillus sacheonensis TaxID=742054 RepID=A0A7X4YRA0_9BACL|nr:glycosyltransferase [Paenibacillus sacheonensis]MBM7563607.1 glycosyltransferase involved in cell wall biosynthesis [Paenibacillus sacheonensis]NBC71097.1 glycosyltransferase [Paenibacillus sacheonensis]
MKASIAICTHNRAADLKEALVSLMKQNCSDPYEVIVVDNRSTDHTRAVVEEFQKLVEIPIVYIYEERLGLSVARNRAIREAAGEYVMFLDDDAVASEEWIRGIVALFDRDPRIGCVGGKIEPAWEGSAPHWLPQENRTLYTILDYADEIVEMRKPDLPFGANVSFRKSVFDTMEPFREDLGRVGSNLLSSEESELIGRIRTRYSVYYTPYASVLHKIPRSRMSRKWLLRRIHWQGVSSAVSSQKKAGILLKSLVKMPLFALLTIVFAYDKRKIFRNVSKVWYSNGQLRGVLKMYP